MTIPDHMKTKPMTSDVIKRHIKEAEADRDALPEDDLISWHFFNGKVVALSLLLRELVTGMKQ